MRVLGPNDEVIRELEHAFTHITMHIRGLDVTIRSTSRAGESEASEAEDMLHTIIDAAYREPMDAVTARRMLDQRVLSNTVRDEAPGHGAATDKVRRARALRRDDARDARGTYRKPHTPGVITYAAGYPVRPKTLGQAGYVQAIDEHTITFGIGPAGTGKTYLAVAKAVRAFQEGQVRRIILTRPAVEAGENLGFLPGSLNEKVDPYLRPLYDALSDMFGPERMRALLDDGTIEVAPLAYMRGRTLNDAYVILDEAQNTTAQQMKMFLTRLGFNTKMVVTGDITLGGSVIHLTDTAGQHDTEDPVERLGVERARRAAAASDVVLAVLDASVPPAADDLALLGQLRGDNTALLLNKADLPARLTPEDAAALLPGATVLSLSAHDPATLQPLRAYLAAQAAVSDALTLTQPRHLEAARRAASHLRQAAEADLMDMAAIDLLSAQSALGEITGDQVEERLLDQVFSQFCVGK